MTTLTDVLRELAGLFVDDGAFALMIIAVVVLTGVVARCCPKCRWWRAASCCLVVSLRFFRA
jgi:hypothetical protein